MNKNAMIAAAGVLATLAAAGCGSTTLTATAPKTTAPVQSPSTSTPSPSPTQQQQAHLGDQFTVALEDGTKYDVMLQRVDQPASPANEFEAAQPGHHLAAAQFQVKATTSVDENANNNATATGSDEQAYTPSIASVAEGTNFANGEIRLQPGDSLVGWVTFELPDGVRITKVQWTPASGFSPRPLNGRSPARLAHQHCLPPIRERPSGRTSPQSPAATTPALGSSADRIRDLRIPALSADWAPPRTTP